MMTSLINRLSVFLFLILLSIQVFAYSEVALVSKRLSNISSTGIAIGSAVSVNNEELGGDYVDLNVKGIVQLEYLQTFQPLSAVPFEKLTLLVEVDYIELQGAVFIDKTKTITLEIDYSNKGVYKSKSIEVLPNVYEISKLTILSAKTETSSVVVLENAIFSDVSLTYSVQVERYKLSVGKVESPFVPAFINDNLVFNWNDVQGAEEYDFEWTHVNAYKGTDKNSILKIDEINIDTKIFERNSTRVTVKESEYSLPYIYDKGYILYRVRAVGRKYLDGVLMKSEGDWNGIISPTPSGITKLSNVPPKMLYVDQVNNTHNDNLNWQYTINYAEEGKSKLSMTYADGSLRARQSQTRVNTSGDIIIGETIYDAEGRPVIQALPVPSEVSTSVAYIHGFNKNSDGSPYNWRDFDTDILTSNAKQAELMNNHSGAAKYYSSNKKVQSNENQFIPDAEGYPFTQIEYTSDNTGRVDGQSGVGQTHQLLSRGGPSERATRYYYGTPEQVELDRLFGSEVGYCDYYKKNMVKDPNGQVSISYLDPAGKVIASSLSGDNPPNLDTITKPFIPNKTLSVDLLNKTLASPNGASNTINLLEKTTVVSKEFLVPTVEETSRVFSYNVEPKKYKELLPAITCNGKTTNASQKCYDCVLDLDISLTDKFGQEFLSRKNSKGEIVTSTIIRENILKDLKEPNYFGTTDHCVESTPVKYVIFDGVTSGKPNNGRTQLQDTSLTIGQHTLTKILKVNSEALQFYANDYVTNNSALAQLDCFKSEALADVEFATCYTCVECQKFVDYPTFESLPNKYKYKLNPTDCKLCFVDSVDYNNFKAYCDPVTGKCGPAKCDECNVGYNSMLVDFNKNGQYANVSNSSPIVADDKMSIFNENNYLSHKFKLNSTTEKIAPSWRNPINYEQWAKGNTDCYHYFNDDQIAYVKVEKLTNGTWSIPLRTSALPADQPRQVEGNVYEVEPQYLLALDDFMPKYVENIEWARSLVYYHPEFAYYIFCEKILKSHEFDMSLANTFNWENASKNIQTALSQSDMKESVRLLLAEDPMFNGSIAFNNLRLDKDMLLLKNWISYRMYKYTRKPIGQTGYYTLWDATWDANNSNVSQYCSTRLLNLGFPDNQINEQTDKDAAWNTFKSLYISLKQELIEYLKEDYAILSNGYCACIGNDNFSPFNHGFISGYYGNQYANSNQPCWILRAPYLKDKQSIFGNPDTGLGIDRTKLSVSDVESSFSSTSSDFADVEGLVVPSYESTKAYTDRLINKTQLKLYETCGQCPQAHNLQFFLSSLIQSGELLSTNRNISCEESSFIADLENAIPATGTTTYVSNSTIPTKLIIQLQKPGGVEYKIELQMPKSYWDNGYRFSDLTSACCLKYVDDYSKLTYPGIPFTKNKNFLIEATAKKDSSEPVKFNVIGVSDYNVGECTFDKECITTDVANDIASLLEVIVQQGSLTSSYNFSSNPVLEPFLTETIKNTILDVKDPLRLETGNWSYSATQIGSELKFNICKGAICSALSIKLPTTESASQITGFRSPLIVDANNPNKFILPVIVTNRTVKKIVQAECVSDFLIFTNCNDSETAINEDDLFKSNFECTTTIVADRLMAEFKSLPKLTNINFSEGGQTYPITLSFTSLKEYTMDDIDPKTIYLLEKDKTKSNKAAFVLRARTNTGEAVTVNGEVLKSLSNAEPFSIGNCYSLETSSECTKLNEANAIEKAIANAIYNNTLELVSQAGNTIVINNPLNPSCAINLIYPKGVSADITKIDEFYNIQPLHVIGGALEQSGNGGVGSVTAGENTYIHPPGDDKEQRCGSDNEGHLVISTSSEDSDDNNVSYIKFNTANLAVSSSPKKVKFHIEYANGSSDRVIQQWLSLYHIPSDIIWSACELLCDSCFENRPQGEIVGSPINVADSIGKWVEWTIPDTYLNQSSEIGFYLEVRNFDTANNEEISAEVQITSLQNSNSNFHPKIEIDNYTASTTPGSSIPTVDNNFIYFSALVKTKDGEIIEIQGNSDCIQIGDCPSGCVEKENLIVNGDFSSNLGYVYPSGSLIESGGTLNTLNVDGCPQCPQFGQAEMGTNQSKDFNTAVILWYQDIDNLVPGEKYIMSFNAYGHDYKYLSVAYEDAKPSLPDLYLRFTSSYKVVDRLFAVKPNVFLKPSIGNSFDLSLYSDEDGLFKAEIIPNSKSIRLYISSYYYANATLLDDISLRKLECTKAPSILCNINVVPTVTIDPIGACIGNKKAIIDYNANSMYKKYLDEIKRDFCLRYIDTCLHSKEEFRMLYNDYEHHFTLYYYDQAGNLVRTVPPAGVHPIYDKDSLDQISLDRQKNEKNIYTSHDMFTTYRFNSLGQLTNMGMPDHNSMNILQASSPLSQLPSNYEVASTEFVNDNVGFMSVVNKNVTSESLLYYTSDAGVTWSEISAGVSDLLDVFTEADGLSYIVGKKGVFIQLNNQTPKVKVTKTNNDLVAVYMDSEVGVIFDVYGNRWNTEDAGDSWSDENKSLSSLLQSTPANPVTVTDIAFNSASEAIAICSDGRTYKTINGGHTWTNITLVRSNTHNAVCFNNGAYILFGADGDIYYKEADKWVKLTTNAPGTILDAYFSGSTAYICIEGQGVFYNSSYKTNPNWTLAQSGDFYRLESVNDHLYAMSNTQSYRLTNGAWSQFSLVPHLSNIQTIADDAATTTINEACTVLSDANNLTIITTLPVAHQLAADIQDLHFVSSTQGVAIIGGHLQTTSNAVDFEDIAVDVDFIDLFFTSMERGYAITSSGKLYKVDYVSSAFSAQLIEPIAPAVANVPNLGLNKIKDFYVKENGAQQLIYAVMVGENGEIWTSLNGYFWYEESNAIKVSGINAVNYDVYAMPVAVGNNGLIMRLNSSVWQIEQTGTNKSLNAIHNDMAVGESGTVLNKASGVWVTESIPTYLGKLFSIVNYNQNLSYAGGEKGAMFIKSFGNWTNLISIDELNGKDFSDCGLIIEGNSIAVGKEGRIFLLKANQ